MPEWSITLITGLLGVLVGSFMRALPSLVRERGKALDASKKQAHEIEEASIESHRTLRRQFLEDIRLERKEMKDELAQVREEHQECLQIKASQQEKIDGLTADIEGLKARVDKLDGNGAT